MKQKVINHLASMIRHELMDSARELLATPPTRSAEEVITLLTGYGYKDIEINLYPSYTGKQDQIIVFNDEAEYTNIERCLSQVLPTYDSLMSLARHESEEQFN